MTPEPAARPSSRGACRRKKRSKSSGPKNSRKRSSISGDAPLSGLASRLTLTLTFTTEGVARSATETNASSRARRSRCESGERAQDHEEERGGESAKRDRHGRASAKHLTALYEGRLLREREGIERQLEDPRGGGGHRRDGAAADARDPDDLAPRLDERGPRALPPRDARVDQERFEPPQRGRAERREEVAAPAGAHRQGGRERVGVEGGAAGLGRDRVV